MKKIIILLILPFSLTAQQRSKIDENTSPNRDSPVHSFKGQNTITNSRPDTQHILLKDTAEIIKQHQASGATIYLVKEEDDNYFFMYIFPVITLLLGMGLNAGVEWLREQNRIKEAGKRWLAEVHAYTITVGQQIPKLDEFLIKANPEVYQFDELEMVVSLNGEIFKTLEKGDLLKYVHKHHEYAHAIYLSNRLNGAIDITVNLSANLKAKYKEYSDGISKYSNSINTKMQDIGKDIGHWGLQVAKEIRANPIDYPHYKNVDDLYQEHIYNKEDKILSDLFELETKFLKPLLTALSPEVDDPLIRQIMDIIGACLHDIKGVRMERKYLRDNVVKIKKLYEEQLTDFSVILSEIENNTQ